MTEVILVYLFLCVMYSAFLMITIYIPVAEELRYVVSERWGYEVLRKIKRFSTFYLFIAWSMGIFFAPYLLYYIIKFGHSECIKSYKNVLWIDIRAEALEIVKYGENDS